MINFEDYCVIKAKIAEIKEPCKGELASAGAKAKWRTTRILSLYSYHAAGHFHTVPLPEGATSLDDSLYVFGATLVNELRFAASLHPPELCQSQVDPPQSHADHQIVAQGDDVRKLQHSGGPGPLCVSTLSYPLVWSTPDV